LPGQIDTTRRTSSGRTSAIGTAGRTCRRLGRRLDRRQARRRRRLSRTGSDLPHSYSRDQSILIRRLRRIEGQVRGIERMIERREYCIDILQQTAALRAAVDSVALLILEDHVQGCVRTAAEQGDADRYIEEVLDVVRRTLGKPVRNPRV
jgi:DNA-binding FrmR family transcriptional regulator